MPIILSLSIVWHMLKRDKKNDSEMTDQYGIAPTSYHRSRNISMENIFQFRDLLEVANDK